MEYVNHKCNTNIPGHCIFYWMLSLTSTKRGSVNGGVPDVCCQEMDQALNAMCWQSRVADTSIKPVEIRVLRSGTFEELMDYAISRGASINQYKVPRCVSFPPIVELLDSRVVSRHLSPSLPHWSPAGRSDE